MITIGLDIGTTSISGLPLMLGKHVEEAAVGAALCAGVGSGGISSFMEAGMYLSTVNN